MRCALLHYYQMTVARTTEATNRLKGYLNQSTIRLNKRSLKNLNTQTWVIKQREWSQAQSLLLKELFLEVAHTAEKRQQAHRMVCIEVSENDTMLALMNLLEIGIINAFALAAIIGDIRRFPDSKKLVAYLGLNPGQRDSGTHKRVKVGVGRHGRRDIRALLTQAAQSLLISSRDCPLAKWGWKLFARKGHRNIAVSTVARKLVVQAWHLLNGNAPTLLEANKKLTLKLTKLASKIGKEGREKLQLPETIALCVEHYDQRLQKLKQISP